MNKKSKLIHSIKGKLISATCMLLVAMIMVVSSTYAWFTLSTAPEVTGIQTAVGANGALEIALLPTSGDANSITSAAGDSAQGWRLKNLTWGNLVDLSDNSFYGLDQITLLPSALNATTDETTGKTTLGATLLNTPVYGSDGRVDILKANTVTSTYKEANGNFPTNDEFGVRGVGVASGMTDRQLAYRNALSSANTFASNANSAAAVSIAQNGNALANIVVKHATGSGTDKYSNAEVDKLLKIVTDLVGDEEEGTTGIIGQLEDAYKNYIIAYVASAAGQTAGVDDTEFQAFYNSVKDLELSAVLAELGKYGVDITAISTHTTKLATTKANTLAAKTALAALKTDADSTKEYIEWGGISAAVQKIADPAAMTVNNLAVEEIKNDPNKLISSVMNNGGGINVKMSTGSGVYAAVADHCGNYDASITIEDVKYGSTDIGDVKANMAVVSTESATYTSLASTAVTGAKAPEGGGTTMPLTELYGYVIDLAFRTNAANSNLLLQTTPVGRIYEEGGSDETMGGGATMTFVSQSPSFTQDKMVNLMKSIRIVFFEPGTHDSNKEVYAFAKLDTANAKLGSDGKTVTADIVIYEFVDTYTYSVTEGENTTITTVYSDGTKYYTDVNFTTQATIPEGVTPTKSATGTEKILRDADAVITSLAQGTAVRVSTLVYLDGNTVTNQDVAATVGTSMSGTMNLQFSSSAPLVPMNYAEFQQTIDELAREVTKGGSITLDALGANETYEVSGTLPTGVTFDNQAGTVTASAEAVVGEKATIIKKNADGKTILKVVITVK